MRHPFFILYSLLICQSHVMVTETFTAAARRHRRVDTAPSPTKYSFARFARAGKTGNEQPKSGRPPSTVTDFDGPTPEPEEWVIPEVDPDDIEGLREVYDPGEFPRPIPHQPWRRGDTDGCHEPITAPWRLKAERIIYDAAAFGANGRPVVLDVTWFLTTVLVTLDYQIINEMPKDLLKARGPEITLRDAQDAVYKDPDAPAIPDIYFPENPVMYQRETPEEAEERKRKRKLSFLKKREEDDPDEPQNPDDIDPLLDIPLYKNEETREEVTHYEAVSGAEYKYLMPEDLTYDSFVVDTAKVSTVAQAILDGLESVEDECHILARHELALTSPGPPHILESQKQFNAHRNAKVIVETHDPFGSNRVLKGILLDRNAMDVYIKKEGRMVTIPLNFVKCVRLAGVSADPDPEADLMP